MKKSQAAFCRSFYVAGAGVALSTVPVIIALAPSSASFATSVILIVAPLEIATGIAARAVWGGPRCDGAVGLDVGEQLRRPPQLLGASGGQF